MRTSRRRSAALGLLAAIGTAACQGSALSGQDAAGRRPGTYVVVPAGSEITKLTTDSSEISLTAANTSAFPLLAYRELCGASRLEEFGLARPRLTVVTRRGNDSRTVLFGDATFTGGGVYALVEGAPCIDVVTTSSVHTIAQSAGDRLASTFQPPPKPDLAKAETADADPIDPWVAQAQRAQARASSPASP